VTGPIVIGPGTEVRVEPPALFSVSVAPPDPSPVGSVVVPVAGPTGPQGTPGAPADDLGVIQTMIDGTVQTHVSTPEPHPAYDDLPSLQLLFENGLV